MAVRGPIPGFASSQWMVHTTRWRTPGLHDGYLDKKVWDDFMLRGLEDRFKNMD
jgi:hypothetical protein